MNGVAGITLKTRFVGLLLMVVIILCGFGLAAAINQKSRMMQEK